MGAEQETPERAKTIRHSNFARQVLEELLGRKIGNKQSFGRFGISFSIKAGEIVEVQVEDLVKYQ